MKKWFSKKGFAALLGTSLFVLAAACGTDGAPGAGPTPTPGDGGNIPVNNPGNNPTPTPTPGYPTQVVDAPIDGLEIVTDPNDPTRFIVRVTSGLPSGCAQFESYGFSKQGRLFTISVQNRVPAEGTEIACTMIYGSVVTEIPLGTVGVDLEACKTYTVRAGDLAETFQAAGPAVQCPAPDTSNGGGGLIADFEALILSLEALGIHAVVADSAQPLELFGRQSTVLKIGEEFVHVFEFSPGHSAHDAADGVSSDGTTFDNFDGTSMSVMWVDAVRFYLYGNAIVHYLGTNQDVIDALNGVGTLFAGEGYEPLPDGELKTVEELAPVVSVSDIRVLESFPVQYALTVRTAQPNGCARPGRVDVSRVGNVISVNVFNEVPAHPEVVLCTMIYGETDNNVSIADDLESSAEYTVVVNGDQSTKQTFVAQ